jgi:hypothetical protein
MLTFQRNTVHGTVQTRIELDISAKLQQVNVRDYCKRSQRNVMNPCKRIYSLVVVQQPRKDNKNQYH